MKISDCNNYIIFKPVNYEFPNLNSNDKNVDHYDLNWLRIQIKYIKNGKEIVDYHNCILTFEIKNFVDESRKLISKFKEKIESAFLEPNLEISVDKKNNVYNLNVKYLYDTDTEDDNGWKYIEINKELDKDEFTDFINEIDKDFNLFPIR